MPGEYGLQTSTGLPKSEIETPAPLVDLRRDTWYAPFAPDFRLFLSVLATIISKTPGERIVMDAGVKALSGQRGLPSVKNIAG